MEVMISSRAPQGINGESLGKLFKRLNAACFGLLVPFLKVPPPLLGCSVRLLCNRMQAGVEAISVCKHRAVAQPLRKVPAGIFVPQDP